MEQTGLVLLGHPALEGRNLSFSPLYSWELETLVDVRHVAGLQDLSPIGIKKFRIHSDVSQEC